MIPGSPARNGKRLILVGPYPAPWGGISVHVKALQELARKEEIPVQVLDVGKGHTKRDGSDGVFSAGSYGRFLSELLGATTGDAVVHTHVPGNNLKSWMVALAVSRARPGGLLTVHSGLAPALIEESAWVRGVVKLACSRYEWILCANHRIAVALEYAGVDPARLEVLPAWVSDPSRTGQAPDPALGLRSSCKTLVSAALAPGPQYGEEILVEGLERLCSRRVDIGCVLFGPGTDGSRLKERLRQAGIADRSVALGEIDQEAAFGVMSVSDVFVRPTLADGDSISVREALGLGIRVVASDVGHRPEGVRLFVPGDPVDLADQIERVLEQPPPQPGTGGAEMARRIVAWWRVMGLDEQGVFA